MFEGLSVDKLESLYHWALVKTKVVGVGSKKADRTLTELLEKHGSFEQIFLAQNRLMGEDALISIPELDKVVRELARSIEFQTLTIASDDYPLKGIEGATPVLYVHGNTDFFGKKTIAVVGTRHPSERQIADGKMAMHQMLEKDYTIVSGLAMGCDGMAHRYAIENEGRTIAVVGTPINKNPVQENRDFYDALLADHLLVSQFPIGVRTFPAHFAYRNHTTVSLAQEGVVVIHAGDKSGTLHAVKVCREQEKPLRILQNNFGKGYKWVEDVVPYLKTNGKVVKPDADS